MKYGYLGKTLQAPICKHKVNTESAVNPNKGNTALLLSTNYVIVAVGTANYSIILSICVRVFVPARFFLSRQLAYKPPEHSRPDSRSPPVVLH